MSESHCVFHCMKCEIKWTEPHRLRKMLDRNLRLTEPDSDPATQVPGSGKVWIERERPVHQRGGLFQFAGEHSERHSRPGKRKGVIFSQTGCLSPEPDGFAIVGSRDRPRSHAPEVAPDRKRVGLCVVGV